jgi:hypothetical protein
MKIAVIPDTQVKPGVDLTYLSKIGEYLVEKQPDVIVHLGDHWDMPSLSSYDIGKKSFEGRRYKNDIQAGNAGMDELLYPIKSYNKRAAANHKPRYRPEMHFLMGNHENRINRAVNNDAKLEGTIGVEDCYLDDWNVHDFLEVVIIGGVAFSHYFVTGIAGRPAATANAQLNKKHQSCIAGHQQGLQIATAHRADGQRLTSIIAGSCYEHDEDYLGAQGNKHWRGMLMLHEVNDGQFDLMPVSLDYINKKYE